MPRTIWLSYRSFLGRSLRRAWKTTAKWKLVLISQEVRSAGNLRIKVWTVHLLLRSPRQQSRLLTLKRTRVGLGNLHRQGQGPGVTLCPLNLHRRGARLMKLNLISFWWISPSRKTKSLELKLWRKRISMLLLATRDLPTNEVKTSKKSYRFNPTSPRTVRHWSPRTMSTILSASPLNGMRIHLRRLVCLKRTKWPFSCLSGSLTQLSWTRIKMINFCKVRATLRRVNSVNSSSRTMSCWPRWIVSLQISKKKSESSRQQRMAVWRGRSS